MREIRNLCDVLLDTHVDEDQCTNFLLWLFRRLPAKCLNEFCVKARLKLGQVTTDYPFRAQLKLEHSRPDALLEFETGRFLLIETKRPNNPLNASQFANHIAGGIKEFGIEKCWFLFISGDSNEPPELDQFRHKHRARIGFLSWIDVFDLLAKFKQQLEKPYAIFIEEFLIFARRHRLGKALLMNEQEMTTFLQAYPAIYRSQEAAQQTFQRLLDSIVQRIVLECEERVTLADDDARDKLPQLYQCLRVKGWHIPLYSLYVVLNALTREIAVLGNGYGSAKEKKEFLSLWNAGFKQLYKNDPKLHAFTWIKQGDDDDAWEGGYFKQVRGTAGKLFDPTHVGDFGDYFQWGYIYRIDQDSLGEPFVAKIGAEVRKL